MTELPSRVYVPQLNRSVRVFTDKSEIPLGFTEEYAAIPEDNISADDRESGIGVVGLIPPPTGAMAHYEALGDMTPGASWPIFIPGWSGLLLKLVAMFLVAAVVLVAVQLLFSRQVQGMDTDGDGIPDQFVITSPWGNGIYDPGTGKYTDTGGGIPDIINQVVTAAIVLVVIGAGAYIAFKVVLPSAARAMEEGAGKAYRFAKRETGEAAGKAYHYVAG